jgi:hypothetical protein
MPSPADARTPPGSARPSAWLIPATGRPDRARRLGTETDQLALDSPIPPAGFSRASLTAAHGSRLDRRPTSRQRDSQQRATGCRCQHQRQPASRRTMTTSPRKHLTERRQHSISLSQPGRRGIALQHLKLMPQQQDLDVMPTRPEAGTTRTSNRSDRETTPPRLERPPPAPTIPSRPSTHRLRARTGSAPSGRARHSTPSNDSAQLAWTRGLCSDDDLAVPREGCDSLETGLGIPVGTSRSNSDTTLIVGTSRSAVLTQPLRLMRGGYCELACVHLVRRHERRSWQVDGTPRPKPSVRLDGNDEVAGWSAHQQEWSEPGHRTASAAGPRSVNEGARP